MATLLAPPVHLPPAQPPVPVRRFSMHEYEQMLATGILRPENRVELLQGWVVPKRSHNPPHNVALTLTAEALRILLPTLWFIREQHPVTAPNSAPEPDVAVVRGKPRDFATRHPAPQDVGLLVEIADSSQADDRTLKAAIYAEAGYAEYWIVNLVDRQVEVYRNPVRDALGWRYASPLVRDETESMALSLAGSRLGIIAVRDLLP